MCQGSQFLVVFPMLALILQQQVTLAGARIDLRPAAPPNGVEYQVGDVFNVEVFMVDTGNPQGDIGFRIIQLDFEDSEGFSFPGTDGANGTQDDNMFTWEGPLASTWTNLPRPAYGCSPPVPNPLCLLVMPDDDEVQIGHLNVRVESLPATLDVMNDDEVDPVFGATTWFGWGGPGDPIFTWRAFNGDITGGVLVIPEPVTLGLVAGIVAFGTVFKRNVLRHRRLPR